MTSKLKEEAMVLYNLRHSNIIQFSGVLWSPPDFGIVMPLVPYGSLDSFIAEYNISSLAKVNKYYGMTFVLIANNISLLT